jgi:hypothetical protein
MMQQIIQLDSLMPLSCRSGKLSFAASIYRVMGIVALIFASWSQATPAVAILWRSWLV